MKRRKQSAPTQAELLDITDKLRTAPCVPALGGDSTRTQWLHNYSVNAGNQLIGFTYDALRRVTGVTFPSTLSESCTYDAVGNLLTKTDRKGQTIDYTYDNLDRLTTKSYPDSTAVNYTYDVMNRLTRTTQPDMTTTNFAYDTRGWRDSCDVCLKPISPLKASNTVRRKHSLDFSF